MIEGLLSISGEGIASPVDPGLMLRHFSSWNALGEELARLLNRKNGFYAFESALLVRSFQNQQCPLGIVEWNQPSLWKEKYSENLGRVLFFAEDVFGAQFCICDDKICTFEPETGVLEPQYFSLSAWANDLIGDYECRTGYPLAHTWQVKNGPLDPGVRLLPKVPFVCGGKFEIDNLYAIDDVNGMLFRASLATQIRDLPDGSRITFEIQKNGSPLP